MRLTREEMVLIAGLCLALVTGAMVKHHRDSRRAEAPGSKPPASEEQRQATR